MSGGTGINGQNNVEIYYLSIHFLNGINPDLLDEEIKNSNITTSLQYFTLNDDIFSIFFETELSNDEKDILDNIILNHNGKIFGNKIFHIPLNKINITSTTYNNICEFQYNINIFKDITHIQCLSKLNKGTSYTIRIYNINDNSIIAEETFNNTNFIYNDINILSNFPDKNSMYEFHIKVLGSNASATIKEISIFYN